MRDHLSVGTRLGPYELVAPIGAGGMGEVWKARDHRLNRTVAIKQLIASNTARFEREAHAIAALNHPHICTLYDVGPDYLVMEFVDGAPLRGPMPLAAALRLAGQIASALEAAHAKGILHRDLKPGNVLVAAGGAKLLDFGIAKLFTDDDRDVTHTAEGIVGTVAYMSPEQAMGKAVDERSDIFSFGALLYETLSGRRAFAGGTSSEIVAGLLRDEPAPLAVPDALARIVARCLRKDPSDRFQRMSEVRAALEQTDAIDEHASIAVLPFVDMSPGKDHEYFSDGLSEEIINALAHIPDLKVIARTSAFAFKGQNVDVRRIAETLGVATVLEGSVRKAGNRIRVTAQLIAAADGSHLWSERYDRELADVFAVQDEISAAITGALTARLAPAVVRQHTPSLRAYEAFLKGRHHLWRITPESLARSREHFEEAIAADPTFALPYTGLSQHFFMLTMFSLMPAHEAMPRMRAEAERALQLDPRLPDAHAMRAVVAALYEYDWPGATREFGLAIADQPVSPWVRQLYAGFFLFYQGRAAEAIEHLSAGLIEDPLSAPLRYLKGCSLLAVGRDAEGTADLEQVLELDDKFLTAIGLLGVRHAWHGNLPEALRRAEQGYALAPWDPVVTGLLAGVLIRAGETSRANEVKERLGDGSAFGAPIGLVVMSLICGDTDQAATWIEKAVEQRYPGIMFFVHLPFGKPLRVSPRWRALAQLMKLPGSESL